MTCTEDCTCSLCRELRGYKLKVKPPAKSERFTTENGPVSTATYTGKPQQGTKYCKNNNKNNRNDNFILKRRMSSDYNKESRHGAAVAPSAAPSATDLNYGFEEQTSVGVRHLNRMKKAQSYNEISCFSKVNRNRYSGGLLEPKMIKSTNNLAEEDDYFSYLPPSPPPSVAVSTQNLKNKIEKQKDHKVIIYFGDSIVHKKNDKTRSGPPTPPPPKSTELNVFHAQRLCEETAEMQFRRQNSVIYKPKRKDTTDEHAKPGKEFMQQLKSVLEEKNRNPPTVVTPTADPMGPGCSATVVITQKKAPAPPVPAVKTTAVVGEIPKRNHTQVVEIRRTDKADATDEQIKSDPLPSFVESVVNGVINIKIEESYKVASDIVQAVFQNDSIDNGYGCVDEDIGDPFDWSFVQNWRARPSGTVANSHVSSPSNNSNSTSSGVNSASTNLQNGSNGLSPGNHYIASSNPVTSGPRIQSPAVATPAPRISKEIAVRPVNGNQDPRNYNLSPVQSLQQCGDTTVSSSNTNGSNNSLSYSTSAMIPERDVGPNKFTSGNHKQQPLHGPQQQPNGPLQNHHGNTHQQGPHRSVSGPTKLTVQSSPVKSQPAMISSGLDKANLNGNGNNNNKRLNANGLSNSNGNLLNSPASSTEPLNSSSNSSSNASSVSHLKQHFAQNHHAIQPYHHSQSQQNSLGGPPQKGLGITRTHHHTGTHDFRGLQRVNECHSSSDENRSSGHASMSDTGHGSSSPGGNRNNGPLGPLPEDRLAAGVTNRSARSRASTNHSRSRHRATPAKIPWGGGGLEDIKLAIQQLTMRSHTSTSTYSSLSAGSESSEPERRLGRYSSLETVNTNVTSADEFVWVDSHNRLVELQHPPWSQHCVLRVLRSGRCREHSERVSVEAVPRLGYLLQRALVRVAREVQRLSGPLGLCSKHEVSGAFKIVLSPALADSCIKACLRAAAMFAVPGDSALKQSKSARAGLQLPVGRFHRWMADARLGRFVHEYAAVYLCAGLENLLEEIFLQCLPTDPTATLTASGLEHAIAGSGDLWGLLQPYAHLNAGRVASGALTMPRWASQTSINSNTQSPTLEPCLLTTCVGSLNELKDLVTRAQQRSQHITMSQSALRVLFYFMRCSQLEHNDIGVATNGGGTNIQELCYERAYVVLPPLVEWLRVSSAHAEYRHALLIDKDDIMQAARLLLPGVDCPPRQIISEEELPSKRLTLSNQSIVSSNHSGQTQPLHGSLSSNSSTSTTSTNIEDSSECGRRATYALAFRLMLTGRGELLIQALSLVPPTTRYDTLNHQGVTALMIAAVRNDDAAIQTLLDAGADPNIEVPTVGTTNCPAIHPETQHWTALTFAACKGNYQAIRILLERGAHVEGGARLSEDKCTLTPLQVASGGGVVEVVSLLLAHGAHAFLSTQLKDSLCFSGSAQRGCYSAISVAAAHGQRVSLRKLLSHPLAPGSREVLSLEEMLAEGDSTSRNQLERQTEVPPTLNKTQIKSLQEAMYHSAENNHLDITIELRALGVPWTLHCWMHALAAAHELRLDAVIDQLLQDFLQVCPDDYSQQFVTECLPLLFNIFRYSKKEGTTLLLADIFSTCFGWEPIKPIKEPVLQPSNGSRIDPKFVNNPELSDVTFRVENRIFYGHKIVLVTASPRLQSMLSSKLNEGTGTPTVQINDIRYHIFELVMQFLYSGGCNTLDVAAGDVLELMAAASFFQLEGLLRYTEARCAEMIDIDNVVAMYIHAKVYNAQKLMEYCQGFLLQNMVALLTYDDSVKRLLFAKKIPNHDVLNGLLATLQTRIKARRNSASVANNASAASVAIRPPSNNKTK
ncbi:ankyrin repeat and BTB/POZ domain-containing protein 2 isoform X2 [Wyeomyia smithii]|uniref:ankyrin repeat and BTB/POZ domain-containing protein 2 isoform X2 n=1 Tax=Wyeomyia smithii TaxID=174621 RepID=UPI0024680E6B|nr:ankyrin repeat and BTB/POZ domain-containing protein 2 isoform X2 [Wyeomyia smithii]